ncbi:tRNA uridine-5-carboxymethylaminomethyl(34) synthesis GTPase MnmE [Variovorax sp. J22P168]|uniref:tRNA uridine-5-carboxymethylaminomethyl(34) synthesis GTPase MnmE n=1 Tax=Variovorax jilinensis TaxID=3053513 RepID=UPI00257756A7|nr:tRNA uridine-5-carboxymethylaminomethyl(34) synthesis GTPase MnmE [Variovorax sp. J22P168]MDM0014224.1 tRNA uridine-5-carboxymethylaminomethyl(34) synthesis GTPase MnmE [Variovorax sp. J22P168]
MLARTADPIVAIATASGRASVGIVRVSGRDLLPLVVALCGRPLRPREASYLPFRDADGSAIDRGLALHFPAPHSFTGEDVFELQAHGGTVVLQLLLARLLAAAAEIDPATGKPRLAGLRVAEPGEFSQRAFLNGKIDLAQAEAIADLIDASTEAAARSASRSLSGAFSAEIQTLLEALVRLRMLVEATLDFPDEEIDFLQEADAAGQLLALQVQLAEVQERARQGALLREGIKVVIAGQPNAGKSSLLNALAGAELAIVSAVAGTTRDVVSQTIQIQGVPLHVVDTAGLRESSDEVEQIGIARAWGQIEDADALLFLHDLTRSATPAYAEADAQIAALLARRLPRSVPVIDVWSKLDAATGEAPGQGVALSARTGEGIERLRQRLLEAAGWHAVPEGVYLARARHVQALARVEDHIAQASGHLAAQARLLDLLAEELRLAQNALNEITGEFGADDLLGVIFSRFCIGK